MLLNEVKVFEWTTLDRYIWVIIGLFFITLNWIVDAFYDTYVLAWLAC